MRRRSVRAATGMAIGGVAPVGHAVPIRTLVDVDLAEHDVVWAAAGHPRTVFPTTYDELVRITGGSGRGRYPCPRHPARLGRPTPAGAFGAFRHGTRTDDLSNVSPGSPSAALLGTGTGDTFGVRDADVRHGRPSPAGPRSPRPRTTSDRRWSVASTREPRNDSGSTWSRCPARVIGPSSSPSGIRAHPIAAGTPVRWPASPGRVSGRRACRAFARSIPPVVADLKRAEGPPAPPRHRDAPVGLQGTFSVWRVRTT